MNYYLISGEMYAKYISSLSATLLELNGKRQDCLIFLDNEQALETKAQMTDNVKRLKDCVSILDLRGLSLAESEKKFAKYRRKFFKEHPKSVLIVCDRLNLQPLFRIIYDTFFIKALVFESDLVDKQMRKIKVNACVTELYQASSCLRIMYFVFCGLLKTVKLFLCAFRFVIQKVRA